MFNIVYHIGKCTMFHLLILSCFLFKHVVFDLLSYLKLFLANMNLIICQFIFSSTLIFVAL